jgi:hypothetical protein
MILQKSGDPGIGEPERVPHPYFETPVHITGRYGFGAQHEP